MRSKKVLTNSEKIDKIHKRVLGNSFSIILFGFFFLLYRCNNNRYKEQIQQTIQKSLKGYYDRYNKGYKDFSNREYNPKYEKGDITLKDYENGQFDAFSWRKAVEKLEKP